MLSMIPYKDVARPKVKLSERQGPDGYVEPQWRRHVVPEVY
jgi:hypothetical protein